MPRKYISSGGDGVVFGILSPPRVFPNRWTSYASLGRWETLT